MVKMNDKQEIVSACGNRQGFSHGEDERQTRNCERMWKPDRGFHMVKTNDKQEIVSAHENPARVFHMKKAEDRVREMRIGHISSYMMGNGLRQLVDQANNEITKANFEYTTGHLYQAGKELGHKTVSFLGNEDRMNFLHGLKESNNLVLIRAQVAQEAIKTLVGEDGADKEKEGVLNSFNKVLIGDQTTATPEAMRSTAQSTLDIFITALNSNYNGEYLFGGTNTMQTPLERYKSGSGEGTSGIVQQAFKDHFGFDVKDEKVTAIKPEEMKAFVNGPLGDLFEQPAWNKHFCKAADELIEARIAPSGETVHASVSANDAGFRHAMKNLVMIAEFGDIGLDEKTQEALSDAARMGTDGKSTGRAITDIVLCSARLGTSRAQVKTANERMDVQLTILNQSRNESIAVDKTEAAFRVNQWMLLVNESHALTAKISKLSLLNFL